MMRGGRSSALDDGSKIPFHHIPGRGPPQEGPTPWQQVRFEGLTDAIRSINLSGSGVAEIADDPASDLRHMVPAPEKAPSLYPEYRSNDTLYIRSIPRAGREFYSVFLKRGSVEYLGSIEMVESPPAVWLTGGAIHPSGEGDVFCSPPMTLPIELMRPLLIGSFKDMVNRSEGIHTYRWLCEISNGAISIEHVSTGRDPYSAVLSFMTGCDPIHRRSDHASGDVFAEMPLTDALRGFYTGTLPGSDGSGHLLGARSVELAISMLLRIDGADAPPSVTGLSRLSEVLCDDRALFDLIDREEMDPFFLQKLFKLNKARQRTDMKGPSDAFPDTHTVNLIASSRRRGLTSGEICALTGMDRDALALTERSFGIEPRIEPAVEGVENRFTPLIMSWPEPSIVLGDDHHRYRSLPCDRIFVTDEIPDHFPDESGSGILFASLDDDMFEILRTAYPGLLRITTAK